MKTSDARSNQHKEKRQAHGSTFSKVMDGRKQPIRGLWIRGARYYARLNVENPLTGIKKNRRVPLIDKDGNPVTRTPGDMTGDYKKNPVEVGAKNVDVVIDQLIQ